MRLKQNSKANHVALLEDDNINHKLVESLTKALIFIDENLDKLKL